MIGLLILSALVYILPIWLILWIIVRIIKSHKNAKKIRNNFNNTDLNNDFYKKN